MYSPLPVENSKSATRTEMDSDRVDFVRVVPQGLEPWTP